jgi:hypothetical protein
MAPSQFEMKYCKSSRKHVAVPAKKGLKLVLHNEVQVPNEEHRPNRKIMPKLPEANQGHFTIKILVVVLRH